MGNLYYKFTIVYGILEAIIGIGLIVLGVMFERSIVGYVFTKAEQLRFAHLFLSYACLTLIFPAVLSLCLLVSFFYPGFIVLAIAEACLGILSLAAGIIVFLKPTSILQHGLIDKFIGSKELIIYIIGAVTCVYGIWVFTHGIMSYVKGRRIKANFKAQQQKAKEAVELSKKRQKVQTNAEKPSEAEPDHQEMGKVELYGKELVFDDGTAFANPASPSKKAYSQKKSPRDGGNGGDFHATLTNFEEDQHVGENEQVFDMEAPLSPRGVNSVLSDGEDEQKAHAGGR